MAKPKEIFNDLNLVLRLNQHIEDITSNEASAASLLTKETSFNVLTELSSLRSPELREEAQFDHQRANFCSFDASNLPFHLQGDQAFNEASALARRRQLRHCETIKDKIQFLWQVARGRKSAEPTNAVSSERIRKLSGASRTSPSPVATMATAVNTINEKEYSEMMLLIFKVLRDDFVLETAQLQIQCDWEVDSHHSDALTYEQFFPALFELVDVWTCDIVEATYVRFLELLTRRITVRVVVFLDDMKLKLALSDNFDEAVVVKAIPLSTIKRFAPVAKVLEGSGVRTIGELASADPQVVETQRAGYLKRNSVSREKIGGDLQHLLDMFRELSQQFEGSDYSLENQSLHRSAPANSRHTPNQGNSDRNGIRGSYAGDRSGGRALETSGACETQVGYDVGVAVEEQGGRGGSNGQALTGAVGRLSGGGSVDSQLRRGIKRINTFHDISVTETSVLDALKSSFLIEKGISIQRKTSLPSIQAELIKFGIDIKAMDATAMENKYAELYETFVLRDGENIQALAQSILTRIKMELAVHGIVVDDVEAEAMYDGFFGSVVTGSGERMVADAKSWVDTTLSSKSYGAYVKEDYHELKSISEVTRLGAGAEDAEFVSLLSTEEDEDDGNGGDTEEGDTFEKAAESPTAKGVSSLSRRPSLLQGTSASPKKDGDQGSIKGQSSRSLLDNNPKDLQSVAVDTKSVASTAADTGAFTDKALVHAGQDKSHDSVNEREKVSEPTDAPSGDGSGEPEQPTSGQENDNESEASEISEKKMASETVADDATARIRDLTAEVASPEATEKVGAGSETNMTGYIDDEGSRRKSLSTPMLPRAHTAARDDAELEDLDGNHKHDNESDRDPQGVGFEYEEEEPAAVEARSPTPEAPVAREPKVPDIVVSGVDSGRFVSVAARYIQLLGLGNVKTILPEASLLELLSSPEKDDIDLLCFDVGSDLDSILSKAAELVALMGRRVILFGGNELELDKSSVVARLCVSEVGVLYFATVPIDFTALRGEILACFEASPHPYIIRQRRATGTFGAAAKLLSTSIRATNMMSVEDDHPRSVMTPPMSVDSSGAKAVKRKASGSQAATPVLPQLAVPKREAFSPFRPLRVIDEMPGADMGLSKRLAPVVPPGYASKATRNSPRISAALRKFMR